MLKPATESNINSLASNCVIKGFIFSIEYENMQNSVLQFS